MSIENEYAANNYHPLDVVIEKGKGVWVWDIEGKKYMDFLSAYSALNHGHVHPKILRAAKKQMANLTLTSRAFRNKQFGLFAKELCELTGFEMMLPMNSGAEAVETALKVARKWGYLKKKIKDGKVEIITCKNNFHGRTISIVSFSTEKQYRQDFGPFTQGFVSVEFNNVPAVKKAINKNTAAILIEPIQGEGGILMPSEGYLEQISKICKKENILLVLDEIQTGLGRTGKLFAYLHEKNAKPDILIVGKALGGGFYPVSAILSKEKILGLLKPGDHGSTFGGNPLASAIARESLKVLTHEKLIENSDKMGNYLMRKLKTIKSKWIKEIRGRGLFIGVELKTESGGARGFCEKLAKEGVLCKETHDMVIRFAPPLIITKKEIDWAFKRIEKVLGKETL